MKREGRQHGMVRTYYISPPPLNLRRDVNLARRKIDSPATAGLFTKVSPKPTNHSKFTGKCGKARCGGCHMHPVCKSKDKTKGNHKHRESDMRANYHVMDGRPGLNFSGFSASAILDHLARNHHDHDEDDEVDDNDDGHGYDSNHAFWEHEEAEGNAEEDKENGNGGYVITQDDDDKIGFSSGGLELDCDEVEEGWSLVGVV